MTGEDRRLLVIVPRPVAPEQLALRQAQLESVALGPGFRFDFRPVKVAPVHFVSHHDYLLGDLAAFEAALDAQEEGYDAVCIDTMTDSGVAPLRSVLDIPVIGPGRVSYLTALMLGQRFSIVTMWDAWKPFYRKSLDEARLADRCASIRAINVEPDGRNLLVGKEDRVLPALEAAARRCIEEDGADVICLGSTTMYQSHGYLRDRLPVPVINPGPLTYKIAEAFLALGLSHSRAAYPGPVAVRARLIKAMLAAGLAAGEAADGEAG